MITAPRFEYALTPVLGLYEPTTTPALPTERLFTKQLLLIPKGAILPGSPPAHLACDLFASIDWTKDGIVVSSALLDEEGYGWSENAAWNDFMLSLRDRHDSLRKRASRLSTGDREILEHLQSVIVFE